MIKECQHCKAPIMGVPQDSLIVDYLRGRLNPPGIIQCSSDSLSSIQHVLCGSPRCDFTIIYFSADVELTGGRKSP